MVDARRVLRVGSDRLSDELGVPARTISRILRRYQVPYLAQCDPLTGEVIRASKQTMTRYERDTPGELIHVDVNKIGRIPDGGGWRAWGRQMGSTAAKKKQRIGYDYIHSAVDDHTRLAYAEIHNDAQGTTAAGFLTRAAVFFASVGIARIETVMTDNHWSYTKSAAFTDALNTIGAGHVTIRPHCPRQNGKVERFNRTLQVEWVCKQVFVSNGERAQALPSGLEYYNHQRRHGSLNRRPPITRVSPT